MGETFVSVALIKFAFLLRGASHYRYQFYTAMQWSQFRPSAWFKELLGANVWKNLKSETETGLSRENDLRLIFSSRV